MHNFTALTMEEIIRRLDEAWRILDDHRRGNAEPDAAYDEARAVLNWGKAE